MGKWCHNAVFGKATNTMPPDDFSCAKAHAIFNAKKELVFPIDATVNVRSGVIFEAEKSNLFENLDKLSVRWQKH